MKLDITVPSSISEIPLVNYQKFLKLQESSNDQEFIAQKMIEIFCGIELKDIVKIKLSSINELIQHFTKIFDEKPKFKPTFKIGDIEFGFIPDLENITFGEYVDLDNYLSKWDTFHKAMAVMYRPITLKKDEKYNIMEYTGASEFSDLMLYAPMDVAISASLFFLDFRKRVVKRYPKLFGERTNKDEQDRTSDFSARTQFGKKWGWYSSIYGLAKGDLTKYDEVTKYGLFKCLTYLTFEAEKNEIEIMEIKKSYK